MACLIRGPKTASKITCRTCDNLLEWTRFEACRIAASRSLWARLAAVQQQAESCVRTLRTPSIATSAKIAYLNWGKSCRGLSGHRVKSNEAGMHDIVGFYRNIEDSRGTAPSRIFRSLHQSCSTPRVCGRGCEDWRVPKSCQKPLRLLHSGRLLQAPWWNTHEPRLAC